MKKIIIIILILSSNKFFAGNLELQRRIDQILNEIPRGTKYGIMIYNPVSRDTIYQKNIFEAIKPASNTKLFTTGAAFSLMGSGYELSTKLFTEDYDLTDGIINGNLYLKGFGNSLFTDKDIDSMVYSLKLIGITAITGKIIGDDSYFDSVYYRDDWIIDEHSNVSLPPVSAIVINRNRLLIHARSLTKGTNFDLIPSCSLIKVKIGTGGGAFQILQKTDENNYEIIINGKARKRRYANYSVDIHNPPLFAAYLLQDKLINAGIYMPGRPSTGITPVDIYEIGKRAVLLKDLACTINKESDNYLAECLFKSIGAFHSEIQGNAFYATQGILTFLKNNNIYCEGTDLVDGSGLSHFNTVTVSSIVQLLEKIYFDELIFTDYFSSLSIAGVDGTLRHRMNGSLAENNFHGKTGTLNGNITLSGYLKSPDGQDLIISILFEYKNGYANKYRAIQDRILQLL